ncbi:hypothetical protein Rhe02_02510 [Rhizocola hellebori]|uniref:CBM2 domain-containing protein n=1 Tax=Rhizocola hellebori TaxID=1392758 RepID=A0A8J3VC26_9ACTN|nr:cellulose binding domain-containing protein [Rhizocola hellebori]GIH02184.1 hypothetical protein Rhe02_02510 [Rhizocola hellebori]
MKLFSRRLATALIASCGIVAATALSFAPAQAASLFTDDFEQPTRNVWLTGGGGTWSVVTEDGSKVYRQTSTTLTPTAWAGSGSGPGTAVTARVKPATVPSASSLVSLAGKVSDPNNLYYVGFHGARLEIGQQKWGQNVVLASTPFAAGAGVWYTLNLSFLNPGTVTGSVSGPGGVFATISAADPGGTSPGDRVGFFMKTAGASFDDLVLSNTLPEPQPPTGPCPVEIVVKVGVNYGNFFTATVNFKNISSVAIVAPWTMRWQFASGQTINSVFNSGWYQVGPVLTLTSVAWFPAVAPGATSGVTIGFTATTPTQAPINAKFNGYSGCTLTFS